LYYSFLFVLAFSHVSAVVLVESLGFRISWVCTW